MKCENIICTLRVYTNINTTDNESDIGNECSTMTMNGNDNDNRSENDNYSGNKNENTNGNIIRSGIGNEKDDDNRFLTKTLQRTMITKMPLTWQWQWQ